MDLVISTAGQWLAPLGGCNDLILGARGSREAHGRVTRSAAALDCSATMSRSTRPNTEPVFGQGGMFYELISNRSDISRGRSTADFSRLAVNGLSRWNRVGFGCWRGAASAKLSSTLEINELLLSHSELIHSLPPHGGRERICDGGKESD